MNLPMRPSLPTPAGAVTIRMNWSVLLATASLGRDCSAPMTAIGRVGGNDLNGAATTGNVCVVSRERVTCDFYSSFTASAREHLPVSAPAREEARLAL